MRVKNSIENVVKFYYLWSCFVCKIFFCKFWHAINLYQQLGLLLREFQSDIFCISMNEDSNNLNFVE